MKTATRFFFHTFLRQSLLVFIFCCIQFSFLHAQEVKKYIGEYSLSGELEGRATYLYQIKNGDKVKEGPFLFTLNLKDSIDIEYKEKYQLQGKYENDKKNGEWEFLYASLRPEDEEYIEGFYIKETASGKVFSIKSDFKDGLANGSWKAMAFNVENSIVRDTTYFSSAAFKEGEFINNIQVQDETHQLVGDFDKNSFLDGEWIIFHNNFSKAIIEYRNYNAGILSSHVIAIDEKKYNLIYEGLSDLNDEDSLLTIIPINKTYFEILKFSSVGSINKNNISEKKIHTIQSATQELILGTFNNLKKHNDYNVWNSKTQFNLPKAKVQKHPFTNKEKTAIKESERIIEEIDAYFDNFLGVTQVEISKNANDTIAKYYKAYTHYEKSFLRIKEIFQELQKPAFEYVNRSLIIPKIFKGTEYPEKIVYEINEEQKEVSFDFPQALKSDQATINSLYVQLKNISANLKNIDAQVQPILKKEEQRADLAHDEKELVHKHDSIIEKFSNESELNEYQQKVSVEVLSYVEKRFKHYAQQSLDKRIETLSSTLSCFDQFLELYDQMERVPKKVAEIKELYTRTVWNPFTMTDMDEIVKERVFNAYKDYLLVYFMDELERNINCESLESKMQDINILFKKMQELRDQDTSELEQKIKRESNPEKLIEAFELNLSKK